MKRFMNEYVNASLEVEKDPLIQKYAEWNGLKYTRAKNEMIGGGYTPKDKPKKALHKTQEQAKDIFDSNNRRNNDLFGVTRINNLLEYDVDGLAKKKDIWIETNPNSTEEAMVNLIDYNKNPRSAKLARKRHLKKLKKKGF